MPNQLPRHPRLRHIAFCDWWVFPRGIHGSGPANLWNALLELKGFTGGLHKWLSILFNSIKHGKPCQPLYKAILWPVPLILWLCEFRSYKSHAELVVMEPPTAQYCGHGFPEIWKGAQQSPTIMVLKPCGWGCCAAVSDLLAELLSIVMINPSCSYM